jgi:hypothetical protein
VEFEEELVDDPPTDETDVELVVSVSLVVVETPCDPPAEASAAVRRPSSRLAS